MPALDQDLLDGVLYLLYLREVIALLGVEIQQDLVREPLGRLPVLPSHFFGGLEDRRRDLLAVELDDLAASLPDQTEELAREPTVKSEQFVLVHEQLQTSRVSGRIRPVVDHDRVVEVDLDRRARVVRFDVRLPLAKRSLKSTVGRDHSLVDSRIVDDLLVVCVGHGC